MGRFQHRLILVPFVVYLLLKLKKSVRVITISHSYHGFYQEPGLGSDSMLFLCETIGCVAAKRHEVELFEPTAVDDGRRVPRPVDSGCGHSLVLQASSKLAMGNLQMSLVSSVSAVVL